MCWFVLHLLQATLRSSIASLTRFNIKYAAPLREYAGPKFSYKLMHSVKSVIASWNLFNAKLTVPRLNAIVAITTFAELREWPPARRVVLFAAAAAASAFSFA